MNGLCLQFERAGGSALHVLCIGDQDYYGWMITLYYTNNFETFLSIVNPPLMG